MVNKSIGHGNDLMVAKYDFLIVACAISNGPEKIVNVIVFYRKQINNFPWSVVLGMKSKCLKFCSETTRLQLVVLLEF